MGEFKIEKPCTHPHCNGAMTKSNSPNTSDISDIHSLGLNHTRPRLRHSDGVNTPYTQTLYKQNTTHIKRINKVVTKNPKIKYDGLYTQIYTVTLCGVSCHNGNRKIIGCFIKRL